MLLKVVVFFGCCLLQEKNTVIWYNNVQCFYIMYNEESLAHNKTERRAYLMNKAQNLGKNPQKDDMNKKIKNVHSNIPQ